MEEYRVASYDKKNYNTYTKIYLDRTTGKNNSYQNKGSMKCLVIYLGISWFAHVLTFPDSKFISDPISISKYVRQCSRFHCLLFTVC